MAQKIKKVMSKHKPVHLSDEQFDELDDTQIALTQLHNLSLATVSDSIGNINFFYHRKLNELLEDINQSIIKIR